MRGISTTSLIGIVLAVPLVAWTVGCGKGETVEPEAAAPPPAEITVEAKLALADAADGTADKIVSRCAGCSLGMDGSSEHALELSGYELHFCSEGCKERFGAEPEKAILALAIPEN